MKNILLCVFLCSSQFLLGQHSILGSWKGLAINQKRVSNKFIAEWNFKNDRQLSVVFDNRPAASDTFNYKRDDNILTLSTPSRDIILNIIYISEDSLTLQDPDKTMLVVLNRKNSPEILNTQDFKVALNILYRLDIPDHDFKLEVIKQAGQTIVYLYENGNLIEIGHLFPVTLHNTKSWYIPFRRTDCFFKFYLDPQKNLVGQFNELTPFQLTPEEHNALNPTNLVVNKPLLQERDTTTNNPTIFMYKYQNRGNTIFIGQSGIRFWEDGTGNRRYLLDNEPVEENLTWSYNYDRSKIYTFEVNRLAAGSSNIACVVYDIQVASSSDFTLLHNNGDYFLID